MFISGPREVARPRGLGESQKHTRFKAAGGPPVSLLWGFSGFLYGFSMVFLWFFYGYSEKPRETQRNPRETPEKPRETPEKRKK
jgi:hypothetical protein